MLRKLYLMNINRLLLVCSLLLAGCVSTESDEDLREVTILYTNDEHGWMEGMKSGQSAASLFDVWEKKEGYSPDGPFLILSGGDNWTGPAISTWTQGKSMIEVMNAMQYDASAVGNHEFDFGLDVFKARAEEADFPYLSANTRWRSNGETPTDIGILPYSITMVNDLRIGIIGLTTRETPIATHPAHVRDLEFIALERAVRQTLPEVEAAGTDLVVIIAHVCVDPLTQLIRATADLNIALMGAGHCNELIAENIEDTVLLGGGYHYEAYAKATFTVNKETKEIVKRKFSTQENRFDTENAGISALIARWASQTQALLAEPLAYSNRALGRYSKALQQLIIDSWLLADPTADVAITNAGGIRIDLPKGPIDLGTIVALMPFDNSILALELDAQSILTALDSGHEPVVAGLEKRRGQWVFTNNGEPLDESRSYRVLVNSFMYAGGDGYWPLSKGDPDAFDTGINYRQPFQDWLEAQGSSEQNPLRL